MKQLSALLLTLVVITPNAPLLAVLPGTSDSANNEAKSTAKVVFTGAQFVPSATAPKLVLNVAGAAVGGDGAPYQLASASLDKDANDVAIVVMTPLANAAPTIDERAAGAATANPFNQASGVSGMALPSDGSVIAAYIGNDGAVAAVVNAATGADGNGCVFNVSTDGKTISSSEILSDPTATITNGFIYGVEAAKSVLGAGDVPLTFAAVSVDEWNKLAADVAPADGRGIAIVGAIDTPVAGSSHLTQRHPGAIDTAVGLGANKLALPIRMDATSSAAAAWGDSLGIAGGDGTAADDMTNAVAASKNVDLHWSDKLNRLYVGLDVKGSGLAGLNAANAKGSVIGVGVVDCSTAAASFSSVIKPPAGVDFATIVPDAVDTAVVAATQTGASTANTMQVTASKVRTMVTSTNKDYLIVNSAVTYNNTAPGRTRVLAALPLASADGLIASVDNTTYGEAVDFVAYPLAAASFPNAMKPAVSIAPNLSANLANLSDLYVDGDSVYISMAGDANGEPTTRGLFRSTALFNAEGAIIGWTPGERVGGDLGMVNSAGYDSNTGNLYALTSQTSGANIATKAINTVKISNWGKTDATIAANDPANNLGSVLADLYPAEAGGIHSIASFNEATAGFNGAANAVDDYELSRLCLMAAVGKNQVSLIQAGVGAADKALLATTDFDTGVAPFTYGAAATSDVVASALDDIAPLSCVELSRSVINANTNHVFVGGYNGLAVATTAGSGEGYNGSTGAASDTLAHLVAAFDDVVQLQPTTAAAKDFTDIRKLVAVRSIVFVMTGTKLFGFSVENGAGAAALGKFVNPATADLDESAVTLDLPVGTQLYDMIAIENGGGDTMTLILATSNGVYHAQVDADATDRNFANGGVAVDATPATLVEDTAGTTILPALQLNYLSSSRAQASPQGNLFVLYADLENPGTGTVKRYAVDVTEAADDRIKLIDNGTAANDIIANVNTFTLSDIRGGFTLNGNTIFQPRSYDVAHGASEVAGLVMNSALDASGTPEGAVATGAAAAISALIDSTVKFLATPAVDPATGFVMVPHQAGIISNQ